MWFNMLNVINISKDDSVHNAVIRNNYAMVCTDQPLYTMCLQKCQTSVAMVTHTKIIILLVHNRVQCISMFNSHVAML